ncbi:MAG: 4'-phosphopantetheinyl transferase superfamily protein [Kofleriaceae bacterium]|nr:4'-phosphopantetheinyl transferase superfamily protein [Kofleriaceae bacterium]
MDELQRGAIVRVPHGVLAMAPIGDASHDDVDPLEVSATAHFSELRRNQFLAGRRCLRRALAALQVVAPPLLVDGRGAPLLPLGVTGSISHKDAQAIALAAHHTDATSAMGRVGVDLERAVAPRRDVSHRILTEPEIAQLQGMSDVQRGRAVTLRFSIKEAMYKALDPMVQRYIGFREVSLQWHGDTVEVQPLILDGQRYAVDVWWIEFDGFWISTARARRA